MDYFFMSAEEKTSNNPIIVMIDERSSSVYARGTGKKGTLEMDWLIEDMSEELKWWGHAGGSDCRLILKSDNEPSIVALREKLGKHHGGAIIPDSPGGRKPRQRKGGRSGENVSGICKGV